jgi:ubiquinone/menaquinone biosynthesis C-methylase UbiE
VSERDRYARSFGSVAEGYEQNRPLYAAAAVDWLFERLPMRDVVDVGAGTGKLTRQLVERGASVVAVEPDPDMRAVFERVVPGVQLLDGRGESIPIGDGAADVVTVGQAFHWFDPPAALREMHRVTRPGGGFALTWNVWSPDDPMLDQLNRLLDGARRADGARWRDEYTVGLFGELEQRRFVERRTMTLEQLEGWAASTSAFVMASREEQESLREAVREIVGGPSAEVLLATDVAVADRV